jgi:deazaflavin-dependent oxidoreductase (nitroreductase family)
MALKSTLVDTGFKFLNAFHRSVLKAGGGRVGRRAFGMKVVELRTVGRRSGIERRTILTAPISDRDKVVLVASKGGDDRDPDWYRNIVARCDVTLVIEGEPVRMVARTASAAQKQELWPQVVEAYKPYASYQRRSSRDIPLVICVRAPDEGEDDSSES